MTAPSILKLLSVRPDGTYGLPVDFAELGSYIKANCGRPIDDERAARHQLRDELYRDGGVDAMKQMIDDIYPDEVVREKRKKWARYARFNNALKRIVNELSTVYAEPALRSVDGNERYQALLERLQIDEQSQEWNRLYNLHKVLLVGFRVRVAPDESREPVLDIITPATWRVVLHPNDNRVVIGHLIRADFRSIRSSWIRKPCWTLWTDYERVLLDDQFQVIEGSYVAHGLGVCPYVMLRRSVTVPGFWPGEEGEDLAAGQVAINLANILLLKETKSATKLPILQGDTSEMARNQVADTDRPISIPDGVAMTVVDVSMDTELFTKAAGHIMEGLAHNHGMTPALVNNEGVQSAEARELMRVPIRELRRQQLPAFRLFERRLAGVMSIVLAKDDPQGEYGFSTTGWMIAFGEEQTPMTPTERVQLHLLRRGAGLDNPVDFLKAENPDLDDDRAKAQIERNIELLTWLVSLMRQLQALGGAPNTSAFDSQQNVSNQQRPMPPQQQGQAA
jgi:hypothetical protein